MINTACVPIVPDVLVVQDVCKIEITRSKRNGRSKTSERRAANGEQK